MTVKELIQKEKAKTYWFCPHITSSSSITPLPLEVGLEYANNNIPLELMNKKVVKVFKEENITCVIWYNEKVEDRTDGVNV